MSSYQSGREQRRDGRDVVRQNRMTVPDPPMPIENGLTPRQSRVLHLQRTLGNRATIRRIIEPSADSDLPAASPANATPASTSDTPPADYRLNYEPPTPFIIEIESYGPGDYPITPAD